MSHPHALSSATHTGRTHPFLRLAQECHQPLLQLYARPTTKAHTRLLQVQTERCYAQLHYLWHHPPPATTDSDTNNMAQMQLQEKDTSKSSANLHQATIVATPSVSSSVVSCPLGRLNDLVATLVSLTSPDRLDQPPSPDHHPRLLDPCHSCALYCQHYEVEQQRWMKYQHELQKHQASVVKETPAHPAEEPTSDSDDPDASDPIDAGVNAPAPQPPVECHPEGSCHRIGCVSSFREQPAMGDSTTTTTDAAAAVEFDPYLLVLQSIFLLRVVFLYLFNDHILIRDENSLDSPPPQPSSSSLPLLSLARLCETFNHWPRELHSQVHSFMDNLQWCCYVHMIVGLRNPGNAGTTPQTNPYQLDGRVWKRIEMKMKEKQIQGIIRTDEMKMQYQLLMSSTPASFLKPPPQLTPSSSTTTANPAACRSPSSLYVLGDSHSITLHAQWLLLCHEQAQTIRWFQMRSYLVVGLKAWHVGQPPLASTPPLTSPYLHQPSMLHHYARLIPPSSKVILIAGEIDCRADEGIMAAVTKGKYATIQAGIEHTVETYLHGVQHLAHTYGWAAIYIHPVCPPYLRGHKVKIARKGWKDFKEEEKRKNSSSAKTDAAGTNPTDSNTTDSIPPSLLHRVHERAILIRDFNMELKKQIEKVSRNDLSSTSSTTTSSTPIISSTSIHDVTSSSNSAISTPSPIAGSTCPIHYLDFYDDLCTIAPSSSNLLSPPLLRSEYTLEGMHLNTKYIPRLERELESVMDQTPNSA